MMKKKLTRFDLQQMKEKGDKAVWMTAYDFTTAQLAERARHGHAAGGRQPRHGPSTAIPEPSR